MPLPQITKSPSDRGQKEHAIWLASLSLLLATIYLFFSLFNLSGVPFLLEGDQQFFWIYGQRMLQGEQPYRDFFQFTTPGTDLVYLAFFHLFSPHIWVTNLVILLLGLALFLVCFSLARQLMRFKLALLTAFLFLVLVYGGRLDATHHWFSALATMCAIRTLLPEMTTARIASSAALLAIASCFTQTVGVAGILAVLLTLAFEQSGQRSWRSILRYQIIALSVFAVVLIALNAYWITAVGFGQFWYSLVTFPRRYVLFGTRFVPELHRPVAILLQRLVVYLSLVVICPLVLWHCIRRRREPVSAATRGPLLLAVLGLILLLEIITRLNWNRIYAISMPAIILLAWFISNRLKVSRYALVAAWFLIVALAAKQVRSRHLDQSRIADLPAGRTLVSYKNHEKLLWLAQHIQADTPFLQAQLLNTYLPLTLHNPLSVDGLWASEPTRPEFVQRSIQQVEQKHLQYILWTPRLATPEVGHEQQDHLEPFRIYLKDHYIRVRAFSDGDELWQRR